MITIYHLDNSRSERIVWLAEELGIPYEQVTFMREQGLSPANLKEIHPLGRAPVIRDGELTLMESGAICEWLVTRYGNGKLAPALTSDDYGRYLQWLHFAEGSAMSGLLAEFMLGMVPGEAAAERAAMMAKRNQDVWQYLDQELARSPYFAGDQFSAADIMMEFCFAFAERIQLTALAPYKHLIAWLERVRARPAYQKAMSNAAPKVEFAFKK